jgi:hypothetical protein
VVGSAEREIQLADDHGKKTVHGEVEKLQPVADHSRGNHTAADRARGLDRVGGGAHLVRILVMGY